MKKNITLIFAMFMLASNTVVASDFFGRLLTPPKITEVHIEGDFSEFPTRYKVLNYNNRNQRLLSPFSEPVYSEEDLERLVTHLSRLKFSVPSVVIQAISQAEWEKSLLKDDRVDTNGDPRR